LADSRIGLYSEGGDKTPQANNSSRRNKEYPEYDPVESRPGSELAKRPDISVKLDYLKSKEVGIA
jgi:hypothetical protein